VLLCWQAGYDVGVHDVYLGTSWQDVNNADYIDTTGIYQGYTIEPNWQCSNLAFNTRYYWRVDGVDFPPMHEGIYKGDVWSFTTAPQRIFVDIDAAGANNGTSWENAYNYLQDALIEADSALKPVEIMVAEGIHTPDSNSTDPNGSGDRNATFQLKNGVTLKGGYAGHGEPDPDARDINLYETILSGDLDGNDVEVNDPCDLENEPTRAENSYHVVTGLEIDANAVLDGFTIIGGNANRYGYEDRGGGMYNYHSNPTLAYCTFLLNSTIGIGGGIYNLDSNPTLVHCTFSANFAGDSGGGMFNKLSSAILNNCVFSDNSAVFGGGIYNQDSSSPILVGCKFTGNSADFLGGCMFNSGGRPALNDCLFSANSATDGGGGILNSASSPKLADCSFNGNFSEHGGAILNQGSSPTLVNCTFSGNSATWGGGMLNEMMSNPLVKNCTFNGNSAALGGGMRNNMMSNPLVKNCTLSGNSHGAISNDMQSGTTLINCILWDNTNSQLSGGSSNIMYSDVEGGWPGLGNIDADPCFADPCNGDYHLKSQVGRWDVNSQSWVLDYVTSPCIDAGNPGCPEANEPAPNGNRRNMGAYGGTAEASKSPANWRSIADMTNDWAVDYNDLKVFVDYWLETGECIPSDLDRSLFVNFNDFAIFGME
jgi:hypothetical protein